MGMSYGRGLGRKAGRTKKCHCENPVWHGEEIRRIGDLSGNGGELVYTLRCRSCNAFWDTRSRAAQKYYPRDGTSWETGGRTYGEWFEEADRARMDHLTARVRSAEQGLAEAEKALASARSALERFQEEVK